METNINHTLPNTGFLRIKDVLKFIPVSRATLYRKMHAGEFPKGYSLGETTIAWRAEDIHAYIHRITSTQAKGKAMT